MQQVVSSATEALRAERCSNASTWAARNALQHGEIFQVDTEPEVAEAAANFLRDCIEIYSELNEGSCGVGDPLSEAETELRKGRILIVLSDAFPAICQHVAFEDLELCAMFASIEHQGLLGNSPLMSPVIRTIRGIIIGAIAAIATRTGENAIRDSETLFGELSTLQGTLRGVVAGALPTDNASFSALRAAKDALIDLALLTSPVESTVKTDYPCITPPPSHPYLTTASLNQISRDCVTTLLTLLQPERCSATIMLMTLESLMILVRQRPELCSLIIPQIAVLSRQVTDASVKIPCHSAVVEALRTACAAILQLPHTSGFHAGVSAAYSLLSAEFEHGSSAATLWTALEQSRRAIERHDPSNKALIDYSIVNVYYASAAIRQRMVEEDEPTAMPVDSVESVNEEKANDLSVTRVPSKKLNMLQTSAGPMPLRKIVDSIIASLLAFDPQTDVIEKLHFEGLQKMQHTACVAAQRAEIARWKAQERRGIDSVQPGRILSCLPEFSFLARQRGQKSLEEAAPRAAFSRAAFLSSLESYRELALATAVPGYHRSALMGQVMRAQALVAHAVLGLPNSIIDSCIDELCLRLFCTTDVDVMETTIPPKACWLLRPLW